MLGIIGLIGALVLLVFLALRGVNMILSAVLCSLIVIATNGLPFAESINDNFLFGKLGAFSFAGNYFLLFAAGAIFGRVMSESHASTSIAMALMAKLGKHRALWIIVLSCALLTYGGVTVFIVVFAMYPLGLRLLKEADIPKRLFVGSLALGAGTFTLSALPGTPSILNVIPSVALGTSLFAGAWLGLFGGAIMFTLGMWYLERQRLKASKNGEGFVPGPADNIPDLTEVGDDLPHWGLALIPMIFVIGTILVPRLLEVSGLATEGPLLEFASTQPILWPSIALVGGSLLAIVLFRSIRKRALKVMGDGTQDAIMPLMMTAGVIGFGGVVVQTGGFQAFTTAVTSADIPPLLSMFAAVNTVSGLTGSSSGGLQIFMATMSDTYLAMGIEPGELHRLVAMASGGFDSLPHGGGVIAMLAITQLTHKQAYRDIFAITVVVPIMATLAAIAVAMVL